MATNNDLLIDANTMHQLNVIKVGEAAARQSLPVLREAREYILKQLSRVDSIGNRKQLGELNRRIEKRLIQIYTKYPSILESEQRSFIKEEYNFQKNTLSEAIQKAQAVSVPPQKKTVSAVMNTPMNIGSKGAAVSLQSLLGNFPRDEAKRVVDRITSGFFSGETTQEISRAIVGTKRNNFRDGLMNITRANAFTIAKTGITHLQEQTKQQLYKNNSDLIKGYRIVATLDSRTSQICRSLDGEEYPIKGMHPKPPFHYNCRSTTAPVLADAFRVDTGATRPSESGAVGANTTYYSWLKNQPAAFQDEALGPTQGRIFRNAGLTPEEFKKASVNQFNQPLDIEEMAQKDKRIAEYLSKSMQ